MRAEVPERPVRITARSGMIFVCNCSEREVSERDETVSQPYFQKLRGERRMVFRSSVDVNGFEGRAVVSVDGHFEDVWKRFGPENYKQTDPHP